MGLTEKSDSQDHQTSAEADHISDQELVQLHNSSNTWPSETLETVIQIQKDFKAISGHKKAKSDQH